MIWGIIIIITIIILSLHEGGWCIWTRSGKKAWWRKGRCVNNFVGNPEFKRIFSV